jgi:DNA-binding NarL/FixJ family response regulator
VTKRPSRDDRPSSTRVEIDAPRDLEAATFDVAGEEFLLLTFPTDASDLGKLTESERQVATELLRGKSYREIARIRGTKVGTVANQVRSIFRKLEIRSRSELARKRAP